MFRMPTVVCVFCYFVVGILSRHNARYKGYKLISFDVTTNETASLLEQLEQEYVELDFWLAPILGRKCMVLIPPSLYIKKIHPWFRDNLINFDVISENVQSLVDAERKSFSKIKKNKRSAGKEYIINHNKYNHYSEIVALLELVKEKYPSYVNISKLAHLTHEGRAVHCLKITSPANLYARKPAIIIEHGIHAREWISPASGLYFVEELLRQYMSGDETASMMMYKYEWFIVPVTNPDGYVYTWEENRFWRKNRRYVKHSCNGVDLNRNFDYQFGTSGVSHDCRSDVYPGDGPFSEPETANIRELVNHLKDRLVGYLSVHSFSQLLLTGWGDKKEATDRPLNYKELDRVGLLMVSSLSNTHYKYYRYATPYELFGPISGTTTDWVLSVLPNVYAYAYELRPLWGGGRSIMSFVLPPDQIIPQGEEFYNSLATFASEIRV